MASNKRIEKLALNNQIVSMRNDVKRARLWLIHNLSRRIKQLNDKKGNEQELAKNARKVERHKSEISVLKCIDIDEVSKFALCRQNDSKKIAVGIENLEAEQRAMLRLSTHKFIMDRVEKFHQANSIPVDRLILLVRSLGLQYQKKKMKKGLTDAPVKRIKKKQAKKLQVSVKQKEEIVDSDNTSEESDSELSDGKEVSAETTENVTESNTTPEEPSSGLPEDQEVNIEPPKEKTETQEKKKEPKISSVPASDTKQSKSVSESTKVAIPDKKENAKLKLKVAWPEAKAPEINKKIGTMEIKQLDLEKLDLDDTVVTDSTSKVPVTAAPIRDSFFLGGVDSSSESEDEQAKKKDFPERRKFNKTDDRQHFSRDRPGRDNRNNVQRNTRNFDEHKGTRKFDDKRANKFANHTPLGKVRQFGVKPNGDSPATAPLPAVDDATLHPSWQAKRKQKDLQIKIGETQGKKIKFDDD